MRGLTLIDVGSGYGVLAELMSGITHSPLGGLEGLKVEGYIAIDVKPQLLEKAIARASALGLCARGHVFNLDTGEGERPDAQVGDIVVLAYVLTHLRTADVGLCEAARLAKPDGVVLIVDTAYATAVATGDAALETTISAIQRGLRHHDFERLDEIGAKHGLRRLSGLDDVRQRFGVGDLSPKHDALGFIGNFGAMEARPAWAGEARAAWENIRGGQLLLTQVRRLYRKDPRGGAACEREAGT